ncbi:D-amino acid aminotransferase [Thiohalomonas denitrificans]|uniref:D-amino acid aminotransferase n=1 Tax=Thiohalomonas denitrificans TaxID=415747 RepID=UPI0026F1396D|nr:D-amino acid aminotransferase [Thiohalomonas denitrificans]
MTDTVFLNGDFLPADEACISVLDRGFMFGDGVYEVIPVYGGRLFRLEHHLDRLDHSLDGIRLENPLPHSRWQSVLEELVRYNGGGDQSLYLQVTRGPARRDHAFPRNVNPTVFAMSSPLAAPSPELHKGISAVTLEDIRWKLCNIKAIALLPNILLRQQALDQGSAEAIMTRDGEVTEGAAANIFMVRNGTVITPPKSNLLLPGITRDLVVELCAHHGLPCEERPIEAAELRDADELWVTSSTKEVVPVTRLDGVPVGNGRPGPVWERMVELYQAYKEAFRRGEVE